MPRSRHVRAYSATRSSTFARHRAERVVDQVRRLLEDRELGAVVEQLAHARESAGASAAREDDRPRGTVQGLSLDRPFRTVSPRAGGWLTSRDEPKTPLRAAEPGLLPRALAAAWSSGRSSTTTRSAPSGSSCSSTSRSASAGWSTRGACSTTTSTCSWRRPSRISRRGMHRLNGLYAMWFNHRYGRVGHLFQNRFDARVVEGDEYLETATHYIFENSSRVGLRRLALAWPGCARLSLQSLADDRSMLLRERR